MPQPPGIERDLRELRRLEQLPQRDADRDDQRVGLIAIEQPTEVGGEQRVPLRPAERIPPRRAVDRAHGHVVLPS